MLAFRVVMTLVRLARRPSGLARLASLRAVTALVLTVLVAGIALVAGAHSAHEMRDETAASAHVAESISPACPPSCPDPSHHHGSHDHSACPTCQVTGKPMLREQRLDAPAGLSTCGAAWTAPVVRPAAIACGPISVRGPPRG